jgi:hypothetical protein
VKEQLEEQEEEEVKMAVYKIFPTQDATLYSAYPSMNTGLDEIIEATTNFKTGSLQIDGDLPQASRFLIQFNSADMAYVSASLIGTSSWTANLQVFVANVEGVDTDTVVLTNAVSQSWNMGTGRFLSDPEITNGVSWIWTNESGSNQWLTSGYSPESTGSYSPLNTPGGGVWWTGSQASQTFSYRSNLDLNFGVKEIVEKWNSGSWNNYGFIVRQDPSQEFIALPNNQITLKYFSVDTHTIYPPALEFKWNDFKWETGSLSVITGSNIYASLDNNPGFFFSESIQRFRINARPQFPQRSFQTSSIYTTQYYLPEGSLYAIKDLDTNEYVVNFDSNYTKISADHSGSYFDLYMNGLEPQRYYTILLQTTSGGSTIVLDNNYSFKVING